MVMQHGGIYSEDERQMEIKHMVYSLELAAISILVRQKLIQLQSPFTLQCDKHKWKRTFKNITLCSLSKASLILMLLLPDV